MTKGRNMLRSAFPLAGAVILMLMAACGFQQTPAASLAGGPDHSKIVTGDAAYPAGQIGGYHYDMIQVSGFGTATGVPDLATLSLGVRVTAETVAEARNAAAASMENVMSALEENGIAAADIATRHFRIHPEYDYSKDRRQRIGFTVSNGLTVTVRKVDTAGAVIDAAVAAGGDHLVFNDLDFAFSDTAAMERQARQAAVADMRGKASQMAEFAGRRLGDLKLISETPVGDVFGDRGGNRLLGYAESAAFALDTPITPGEGEIAVIVFGVYELR